MHHFGLFAAVGAAVAALATGLVSREVLRWSRNRMTVVTAVLFLLGLTFATTNGWWYVSSYGVPFNNTMPNILGISVSAIFLALFGLSALYTAWLHIIARRDEISVSKAFANILEKHADLTDPSISEPAHKSRLHLWASLTHIAILDRLSVKWGLTRSDVARRLIDRELASGR